MDESRLEYLEGRVEEQSRNWERLFADVGRVDQKIDAVGAHLSARIDRLDQKIDGVGVHLSARIDRLDHKIDALGIALSARIDAGTSRYEVLDQKLDATIGGLRAEMATQFHWTIGIMTALVTGVLAAVLTQ